MTLSTYPISNGLPAFNLGPSFLEYAIQREMKMSENKHTPGPWSRVDTADYAEIHAPGSKQPIALVGTAEDANAVAAVPDMLEALHAVLIVFSQEPAREGSLLILGIRAAIAKAEGR